VLSRCQVFRHTRILSQDRQAGSIAA